MPINPNIYMQYAQMMPKQSNFTAGLSSLRDYYLRERDNNWRKGVREEQLQMRQDWNQRQQDVANDRKIAQSIANNVGVTPDQTVQGRAMQMLPYDQGMATGLAQLGEMYKPEEPTYSIHEGEGNQLFYMPNKPGEATPSGVFAPEKKTAVDMSNMTIGGEGMLGKVAEGYRRIKHQDGSYEDVAIKGSKPWLAIEAAKKAEQEKNDKIEGRQTQKARAGTTVIQDLQRALDLVQTNPRVTGMEAGLLKHWTESDAGATYGFIESALSNVGLDTLQTMRENSPTGGALGQVPIQQQKRLEQVLGSLKQEQRKEVVEDNLKRVINYYMDIVYGSPKQIQNLVRAGKISEEEAAPLMERKELSFDAFGDPINKGKKQNGGFKFLGFEQ